MKQILVLIIVLVLIFYLYNYIVNLYKRKAYLKAGEKWDDIVEELRKRK